MNYFFSICSLSLNYIYPLIIMPLVISNYGLSNFGMFSVICSLVNLINTCILFNFDISLPSKFKKNVNNIFRSVFIFRFLIFLFFLILMMILSFYLNYGYKWWFLSFLFLGSIINTSYIHIYNQNFKIIFVCSMYAKLLSAVCTFGVIFFYGDIYLLSMAASLWILISPLLLFIKKDKFYCNKKIGVINLFKVSYKSFISILFSLFLTTLVQPLISYISNFSIAGQYAIYEKIIRAVLSLFDSIYKVFYTNVINNRNFKVWLVRVGYLSVTFVSISIVMVTLLSHYNFSYNSIGINNYIEPITYIIIVVFMCSVGNGCVMTVLYPKSNYNAVNISLLFSVSLFLFLFLLVYLGFIEASVINFLIILMLSEFSSNAIKVFFTYYEIKNETLNNN